MRSLIVFGAVMASLTAQSASAAALTAPAGQVDPLLSLSLLASEHTRALACQQGDGAAGSNFAATSDNCAPAEQKEGPARPESHGGEQVAAAHAGWGSVWPFAILGLAGLAGLIAALQGSSHSGHPVSPS